MSAIPGCEIETTHRAMDCSIETNDLNNYQVGRKFSKITEHDKEDEVELHDEIICDIPDEDSLLLVQFHGTSKSHKTELVRSFSMTKVTYQYLID